VHPASTHFSHELAFVNAESHTLAALDLDSVGKTFEVEFEVVVVALVLDGLLQTQLAPCVFVLLAAGEELLSLVQVGETVDLEVGIFLLFSRNLAAVLLAADEVLDVVAPVDGGFLGTALLGLVVAAALELAAVVILVVLGLHVGVQTGLLQFLVLAEVAVHDVVVADATHLVVGHVEFTPEFVQFAAHVAFARLVGVQLVFKLADLGLVLVQAAFVFYRGASSAGVARLVA